MNNCEKRNSEINPSKVKRNNARIEKWRTLIPKLKEKLAKNGISNKSTEIFSLFFFKKETE